MNVMSIIARDPPLAPKLNDYHRLEFRRSAISEEMMIRCGAYSSADCTHLATIVGWKRWNQRLGSAWVIPYLDETGRTVTYNVKPNNPLKRAGRLQKYIAPKGEKARVYIPPGVHELMRDPSYRIIITEGEKKALSATSAGFNAVAVRGIDTWHAAGFTTLTDDLQRFAWNGREAFVCFDSDAAENEQVESASRLLANQLSQAGATTRIIRLPSGPEGEKWGLDDFLYHRGPAEFETLIIRAEEPLAVLPHEQKAGAKEIDFASEAAWFLAARSEDGSSCFRYWNNFWYHWRRGRYRELSDAEMEAIVIEHLNNHYLGVANKHISNTLQQLRAAAIVPNAAKQPTWLKSNEWRVEDVLATNGTLVHLPSLQTREPTPDLFSTVAVHVDYDTDAPSPIDWLAFLDQIFDGDEESIRTLQHWMGYCLTPDTSFQSMLMLIGPPRSGKGTIARTLTQLIGEECVCSPRLSSFSNQFGLQPLIGKTLAVFTDARLDVQYGQQILETLLAISGEDKLTIDRKHKPAITTRLQTRLMMLSNELPRLKDTAGALKSRLIALQTRRSFVGAEDYDLEAKLEAELPAILQWAIRGWHDLRKVGRFTLPQSSAELMNDFEELTNPTMQFVRERCDLDETLEAGVYKRDLYLAYQGWCVAAGRKPTSNSVFFRDLKSALPRLREERPEAPLMATFSVQGPEADLGRDPGRDPGRRERVIRGISLVAIS